MFGSPDSWDWFRKMLSEGHGSVGRAFRPDSRSDRAVESSLNRGALAPEAFLKPVLIP